jgi:hypothetical protein
MKARAIIAGTALLALAAGILVFWQYRMIVRLELELGRASESAAGAELAGTASDLPGDDREALREALTGKQGGKSLERLRQLAQSLNRGQALAWLADIVALPATANSRAVLGIVLGRLTALDPKAALTWVDGVPSAQLRDELEAIVLAQWAETDSAGALTAINGISNLRLRQTMLEQVLPKMVDTDPQGAVRALQGWGGGDLGVTGGLGELYGKIFSAWAAQDPAGAVAAMSGLPPSRTRNRAILGLVDGWASMDPQAALAWVSNLPAGSTRNQAVSAAFNAMAQQDPIAALSYVRNVADPASQNQLTLQVISQWGQSDPKAALAWAQQAMTDETLERAVVSLLGPLSQEDSATALGYLAQMPEGPERDAAVSQIALANQGNPQGDLTWILSLPNTATNRKLMLTVLNNWANNDPDAATAFAQTLPSSDPNFGKMIMTVATNRFVADPGAATAWAEALPEGSGREQALRTVATQYLATDPQQAWSVAVQLPAGNATNDVLMSVVNRWAAVNPAAAAAAIQGANLSDAQKQVLLGQMQGAYGN